MSSRLAQAYQAPLRDLRFIVEDLLDAPASWATLSSLQGIDPATVREVLSAAASFAEQVLAPLNASGDAQGCTFGVGGAVRTPDGFPGAYRAFTEAGWPALAADPSAGGQGLPELVDALMHEMLVGANHAWSMYPGLLHGAVELLRLHGSAALRQAYLPRLVSGEWLAAMALTEPQAGSDLGLVRTRGNLQPDGSVLVTGGKIFVSGGEHDMTDNIVHLVLCRLDGAPVGTRGLSLVLVPKILPDGQRNRMVCDGIERKMGLHGSATCSMRYDASRGWLVGEMHRGLAAMFVLMNSARLRTGMQGIAHADAALQIAGRYASDRRQGRTPGTASITRTQSDADPIDGHPAVRRKLLALRAFVEGGRAVGALTAMRLDVAHHHPDPLQKASALADASLLTPAFKGFFTGEGFRRVSEALQVLGGYGYLTDYGVEQHLRDARIPMLYEGTNEIQAIDLLVRKVMGNAAAAEAFNRLLDFAEAEASRCARSDLPESFSRALDAQCDAARDALQCLRRATPADESLPFRVADDFQAAMGHLLLAWSWCAAARVSTEIDDRAFADRKMETCRFGVDWMLDEGLLYWKRVVRASDVAAAESASALPSPA